MNKWDIRFFELAKYIAQWSKDPSTKVGAVIVAKDVKNKVAFGYNGFPPGIKDTEERLNNKQEKYMYIQHAERNALDNAMFDLSGATLYTTKFPCASCTKSIISTGITRIVSSHADTDSNWVEEHKFSLKMLEEVGIKIGYVT